MKEKETYRCKRCTKPASADLICQSCKIDLLSHFEASSDWQTAYEIEKAQLTASRYQMEERDDNDPFFY